MGIEETGNESKIVDFKGKIDFSLPHDRCEIIKDIVAMANSGGGHILIGVNDDGTLSGFDITPILALDPAKITDQIAKYTQEQFSDFQICEANRKGQRIAVLRIKGSHLPMIFTASGNYNEGGKTKSAFSEGTIYFRHGAKSEPGNSRDLKNALERELQRTKRNWLNGIRKIVDAPPDAQVQIVTSTVKPSSQPGATPIRFTNDPNAPAYRNEDPNISHPHRQKEVVKLLNERIKGHRPITQYDILCVRRIYGTETNPLHCYKPIFGLAQYSNEFIEWLIEQYKKDADFFDSARNKYKRHKKLKANHKS